MLLLLSKIVTGEARGESYEGQVAVAAVVINRVKDPRFPNTIKDVVFERNGGEFSPCMPGKGSFFNSAIAALSISTA